MSHTDEKRTHMAFEYDLRATMSRKSRRHASMPALAARELSAALAQPRTLLRPPSRLASAYESFIFRL